MKKEDLEITDKPDKLFIKILRYITKFLISTPFIMLWVLMDLVAYPCFAIAYMFYAMYKFGEKEEIMSYNEFVKSADYDGFIYNWLKDNVFKK